jgi:Domain of unknown function (DUF305)
MNVLLAKAIAAHGGIDRCGKLNRTSATIVPSGGLLAMKGLELDPKPILGAAATRTERRYRGFRATGQERGFKKTANARCPMKCARIVAFVILVPTLAAPLPQKGSDRSSENGTARPGWRALQQSMETMHATMMAEGPSGNNDVDFVKLMIPHHQAAIDMAKAQLLYGKDPQMRRLAQEIITDQQSEIELMHLWLKQHQPR